MSKMFRRGPLSALLRRTYATNTEFSKNALEHFKAKAPPSGEVLTMAKLKEILNGRLGHTAWLNRHSRVEPHASPKGPPTTKNEQPPREMSKTFTTALIPLSKDISLQDKYVTFLGMVRLGRLMEDLDIFAVWVASNHLTDPTRETRLSHGNIVTLLVDSIDFAEELLQAKRDIRVSGFVSYCGGSTIETELWMEQQDGNDEWKIFTNARFLMALRDPLTNKAAPVNRLVASDAFERRLLEHAQERRKTKRAEEKSSLYVVGPNASESKLVHRLIYENVIDEDSIPFRGELEEGAVLLEKARLSTTVFSHPEDRNMYNTVFGGYLMRLAVELSWSCAWLHTGQRPQVLRIGDIRFHRPVPVASLLRLRAHLIYTEGRCAVVKVTAFVHGPDTSGTFRTNDFHLTYRLREPAPPVLPRSYESALMYLEGRRRLRDATSSSGGGGDSSTPPS